MKNQYYAAVVFLILSISFFQGRAEQPGIDGSKLMLKSGIIVSQQDWDIRSSSPVLPAEIFEGRYYRILQFNSVPVKTEKQNLELAGIHFISYIPNNAFIVSIPASLNLRSLQGHSFRTMLSLTENMKLSKPLAEKNYPGYATKEPGMIDLMLQYFNDIPSGLVEQALAARNIRVIQSYPIASQMYIRVQIVGINSLAGAAFVKYLQPIAPPSEPEDTKGRSLHRSNFINADYATGRHYDGAGVSISLADDGEVGPHIDFTGRLTNIINTGPGGTHGDMTSGIAVGAGNLDPTIRGMGSGAHIYVHDIGAGASGYDHIYNAPLYDSIYGAVITSTSYSQGCNDYDLFSQTGDQTVRLHPEINMVFSAGNNAQSDCGYGAGSPWGTITGGFKQGKNVIACANLDAYEVLDNTSSHGPSADGRVKPDISSNGKDEMSTDEGNTYQVGGGTSAACPGIAGVSSQLYQAYRQLNGGSNPESPLIKASLLNSAEDIGNPGPDFIYGWGRVNAFRALQVLENHHYILDSVSQGNVRSSGIAVPAGVQQVRIMVYWLDYEGDPLATIDLVNDLDLSVEGPTSILYSPWVLNAAPNATTLNANAVTGSDHLNNMEQVTVNNPIVGNYTVNVTGTAVPQGPQRYYIVWEFRTDSITMTYPNGGEGFVPGEVELLRWDAFGTTGNFTLEYSTNNGSTWTMISNSIGGDQRQYQWFVPNTVSDRALVRVSRGGQSDQSDATLSIIYTPDNLSIDFVCVDSLQLSWTAVNGASAYEVSMLGLMYMDSVATTSNTNIKIAVPQAADTWFSVKAVGPNAGKGRRALAIHKIPGMMNCSLASDMGIVSFVSPLAGNLYGCQNLSAIPITISLQNNGINNAGNFTISYSINGSAPVTETYTGSIVHGAILNYTFASTYNFSTPGTYNITANIVYSGDLNPGNDLITIQVVVAPNGIIPMTEDFQGVTFPPANWTILSSGVTYQWSPKVGIIGSSGTSTTAAWFNNYSYNNPGAEDNLTTMLFDLHGVTGPLLTFDVAFAQYGTSNDGLRIDISTDCGSTFLPSTYNKIGAALGTVPGTNSSWVPVQASNWRRDSLILVPYTNQNVIIRFVNINDYGNNLYFDNVNVTNNPFLGVENTVQPVMLAVYPNPSPGIFTVNIRNMKSQKLSFSVFDSEGREVWRDSRTNSTDHFTGKIDLSNFGKGIYMLRVTGGDKVYMLRLAIL